MELLGLIEEGVKLSRPETTDLRSWGFDDNEKSGKAV
jgi:hypothetical protein